MRATRCRVADLHASLLVPGHCLVSAPLMSDATLTAGVEHKRRGGGATGSWRAPGSLFATCELTRGRNPTARPAAPAAHSPSSGCVGQCIPGSISRCHTDPYEVHGNDNVLDQVVLRALPGIFVGAVTRTAQGLQAGPAHRAAGAVLRSTYVSLPTPAVGHAGHATLLSHRVLNTDRLS